MLAWIACVMVMLAQPQAADPVRDVLARVQATTEPNRWADVAWLSTVFEREHEAGIELARAARLEAALDAEGVAGALSRLEAAGVFEALDRLAASHHALAPAGTGRGLDRDPTPTSALMFHAYASLARVRTHDDGAERARSFGHALACARHLAAMGTSSDLNASGIVLELCWRAASEWRGDAAAMTQVAEAQRVGIEREFWFDVERTQARADIARFLPEREPEEDDESAEARARQRRSAQDAMEFVIDSAIEGEFPPLPDLEPDARHALLASMNDPRLLSARVSRVRSLDVGLRVVLALRASREVTGAPADSIASLSPRWLDDRDVRAAGEFLALRERGEIEAGAARRGRVLYAFGADARDDAGVEDGSRPLRAFEPGGIGLDFVLWRSDAPARP